VFSAGDLTAFILYRSRSRWRGERAYHDIHYYLLPQASTSHQRHETLIGLVNLGSNSCILTSGLEDPKVNDLWYVHVALELAYVQILEHSVILYLVFDQINVNCH
jgi:hypothetical protein